MLGMSPTEIALGAVVYISTVLYPPLFYQRTRYFVAHFTVKTALIANFEAAQLHTKSTEICN